MAKIPRSSDMVLVKDEEDHRGAPLIRFCPDHSGTPLTQMIVHHGTNDVEAGGQCPRDYKIYRPAATYAPS